MFSPIIEVIAITWYGWIVCLVFTYITFFLTIMEEYVEPRINKIKKEKILKNYANGGFILNDKSIAGIINTGYFVKEEYLKDLKEKCIMQSEEIEKWYFRKIEKKKYAILDNNQIQIKEVKSSLLPEEILRNYPLGYRAVEVRDCNENDEVSQN